MKGRDRPVSRLRACGRVVAGRTLLAAVLLSAAGLARADCFDDAAQYHKVNPWVLRAIAARESGFNPLAIGLNSNHTADLGQMGINTVHLPELARYGIAKEDLFDGCKNIYVAGWRLAKMIKKYGNNYTGIGAYHSENPGPRDLYGSLIRQTINFWIAKGIIPTP